MRTLSFEVSQQEHAAIVAAVNAEGMTRPAWLRQVALAAIGRQLPRTCKRSVSYYSRRCAGKKH